MQALQAAGGDTGTTRRGTGVQVRRQNFGFVVVQPCSGAWLRTVVRTRGPPPLGCGVLGSTSREKTVQAAAIAVVVLPIAASAAVGKHRCELLTL